MRVAVLIYVCITAGLGFAGARVTLSHHYSRLYAGSCKRGGREVGEGRVNEIWLPWAPQGAVCFILA